MTEPDDTQRLLHELADCIQQTIAAVSQTEEPAEELPKVVDGGMKDILAKHVVDERTLERLNETAGVHAVAAAGWGRALALAQQRYDGEW
jgi:hypothetical protein